MSLATYLFENLTVLLTIGVVILGIFWSWVLYTNSYWKRHNMPYITPVPLLGSIKDIVTYSTNIAVHFQNLYNDKKTANEAAVGIYILNKPGLLIRDLELIKTIMVKDFNKFSNRFSASDPHTDVLGSENLLFVKNPKWKQIRTTITPVFTSGKIKTMFPLVEEIGIELDRFLCSLPIDPKTKVTMQEIKEINACFTTDVIGTIAFGIRANSIGDPNSQFRENGRRIFQNSWKRHFEFLSTYFWPHLVWLLNVKLFSAETTKFLRQNLNFIIDERIKMGNKRNDIIDILAEFRKNAEVDRKDPNKFVLEGDALIAQAALFFSAGFETSSTTMSFSLYELSKRQDLQSRLREEIRETLIKNNGRLSYESLQEMTYLHQVVQEVLRLYPPLPFLDRECTLGKDEKSYSLKPYYEYELPHGMPVFIPIYALQRDPKYFPNPDEFDPERFSPENKQNVPPYSYMPFGSGPHNCIGERFGLLQTKVGIINFLRNHYVTPSEKSHPKMKLETWALVLQSEGGIYCNIVRDPLL